MDACRRDFVRLAEALCEDVDVQVDRDRDRDVVGSARPIYTGFRSKSSSWEKEQPAALFGVLLEFAQRIQVITRTISSPYNLTLYHPISLPPSHHPLTLRSPSAHPLFPVVGRSVTTPSLTNSNLLHPYHPFSLRISYSWWKRGMPKWCASASGSSRTTLTRGWARWFGPWRA